jgi:hypothetical protein
MHSSICAAFLATTAFAGCSHPINNDNDAGPGVAPTTSVAQLPAPFSSVRIGMTRSELEAAFAPDEDLSNCTPKLVGGNAPRSLQIPGADTHAHSRCARSIDIGGLTLNEATQIAQTDGRVSSGDPVDVQEGELYTYAQVRGTLRSGAVPTAALVEAARGRSPTAFGAVSQVVRDLFTGGLTFARAHSSRRELSALISDKCDDMDAARVASYVAGGYSLGQIDADAHSRVVYGSCRGPFLQHEKSLATRLVRRAGAFGGIGLARAARSDRQLDPQNPSTFAVYESRSNLEAGVAKFGVEIANALPVAEGYWHGTVALDAPAANRGEWQSAVAWLRDDRVVRVLVNVGDDAKLAELPAVLAKVYGSTGRTQGTETTWEQPGGLSATLDIGAVTSLTIEGSTSASALPTTAGGPRSVPGSTHVGGAAAAEMSSCCAALDDALGHAAVGERSGYATLLLGCSMNNPGPAAGRKSQLRNNAGALNLPPLPPACQ